MKKPRTKLDQERLLKHQTGEINEYLDEVGQENEEKAAKAVIEVEKQKAKEQEEDEAKKREVIESALRFTRKEYVHKLAETLNYLAKGMDMPKGYRYWIGFDDTKLNLIIYCRNGKKFGRGIKPCGDTKYDINALAVLISQCENTIDKVEKRGNYREDGIILPNGVK